ncbi:MAG: hypothetical protein CL691_03925 [Cellvibrionales bacterium]|nr:hypothetical protein [Cellvibrionales bacterium]
MLNKFKVFLLSIYFYLPTVLAEEVLYCIDELGTGISKESSYSAWESSGMKPERRTMKFSDGYTKMTFIGENLTCIDMIPNYVSCTEERGLNVQYDLGTKRYVFAFNNGLAYLKNEAKIDLLMSYISVGKCESF